MKARTAVLITVTVAALLTYASGALTADASHPMTFEGFACGFVFFFVMVGGFVTLCGLDAFEGDCQ
jgi:hypothetical protein